MSLSFQDKVKPVISTSTPSFMAKATPVAAPAPVQGPVQQEAPVKLWDTSGFKAGFTGAAKSIGKTAMGIGVLGRGIQKAVGLNIGNQSDGIFDKGSQANVKATEFLKPKNTAEGAAVLGADLAQYVLPGSAATKATKAMSIVPRTLLRSVPDVAVSALQSQGDAGITATVGASSIAANLLTPGVKSGMIRKAMSTIAPGYISDVGTGLTGARGEDRTGANAFIPGIGTAIGAGFAAGQGVAKVASNIRHPEVRTINKRGKTLNTIINTYSKVGDAVKQADDKMAGTKMADGSDMSVRKILSESNLLNGAVDENGKVSKGLALQNFDNFISPYEARVREEIQKEARTVPIQQLAREVDDFAMKTRLESGAYEDMLSNLTKDFNGLQAKYGDNIPVEALHDTKIFRNTHANYMDTGANEASKEAARFFKEQVEKNVGGIDVKAFNAELSKFYALKNVIEALDKTRVEGGRLGKHFATVVGTGIGGMFGGAGGAAGGAVIAPKIKGEMMRRAFGGLLSKDLEATPALKETSAGRTGAAAIPDLVIPKKPSSGAVLNLGNSQGASVAGAKTGSIPVKEVKDVVKKAAMPASVVGKALSKPSESMVKMAKSAKYRFSDFESDMSGNRLFHGTANDFDEFDITMAGKTHQSDFGKGIYLTPDEGLADGYRRSAIQGTEKKGVVKEMYIDPGAKVKEYHEGSIGKNFDKAEDLQKQGYDAIYAYRKDGGLEEVIVMNPKVLYDSGKLKKIWEKAVGTSSEVADNKMPASIVGTKTTEKAPNIIAEAKKHTDVDLFIKSQGTPIYHATNRQFKEFDPGANPKDYGTWFSTSPDVKSDNYPILHERVLPKNVKLIDESKLDDFMNSTLDDDRPLHETLMSRGYSGIRYGDDSMQLFAPNSDTINASDLKKTWFEVTGNKTPDNDAFKAFARIPNLPKKQAAVQEASIEKYLNKTDELKSEYLAANTINGVPVANADEARKLFKDVGYVPAEPQAVHEASSRLAKDIYEFGLTRSGKYTNLFAGGAGSGKTSAIRDAVPGIMDDVAVTLDGTLAKYESADKAIKQAHAAGKIARIPYAYRDPYESFFGGVIQRALLNKSEGGRVVPITEFIKGHKGSLETMNKLMSEKRDNVELWIVDNSAGPGQAKISTLDEINKKAQDIDRAKLEAIARDKEAQKKAYGKSLTEQQIANILEAID